MHRAMILLLGFFVGTSALRAASPERYFYVAEQSLEDVVKDLHNSEALEAPVFFEVTEKTVSAGEVLVVLRPRIIEALDAQIGDVTLRLRSGDKSKEREYLVNFSSKGGTASGPAVLSALDEKRSIVSFEIAHSTYPSWLQYVLIESLLRSGKILKKSRFPNK